jgi:hypothetical protein
MAPPFNSSACGFVAKFFSPARTTPTTIMTDLIYLAVTLGFFALCALYARFCNNL